MAKYTAHLTTVVLDYAEAIRGDSPDSPMSKRSALATASAVACHLAMVGYPNHDICEILQQSAAWIRDPEMF